MEKLTLKEALDQGYTKYCYANDGFQCLRDLDEISEEELLRDDLVLVDKEPFHPIGISSKDIAELLADHLQCQHTDDIGDDTNEVFDAINNIDFIEAENKIHEVLSKMEYFRATKIQLTGILS